MLNARTPGNDSNAAVKKVKTLKSVAEHGSLIYSTTIPCDILILILELIMYTTKSG
jgi:hypothetical protein